MGMFDYLRCSYPMPREGANALEFQTGGLESRMDLYEIRADGTLWREAYDTEDRSDKTLPEGSFMRLAGMFTPVNKRWEQVVMTGEVAFSAHIGPGYERADYVSFSAYFVRGQLKHLEDLTRGDP